MFKRLIQFVCLITSALLVLPASSLAVETPLISFDTDRGTLSANISNRPLSEVMRQLSEQTGIKSEVMPEADSSISLRFPAMPMKRAIEQLVRGTNHVYLYQKQGEEYVISGIRVLASGEEGNVIEISEPQVSVVVSEESAKEDDMELQHQRRIEEIKMSRLRRDRNLPPVGLLQRDPRAVRRGNATEREDSNNGH